MLSQTVILKFHVLTVNIQLEMQVKIKATVTLLFWLINIIKLSKGSTTIFIEI
jgi:hypothetical protein